VIYRKRWTWLDEDDELGVFVPGLMATGILVSIGMLIWDGIRRFLPDLGRKQRAARSVGRVSGRMSDLASIEQNEPPSYVRVHRVRRSRRSALVLSACALTASAATFYIAFSAYHESEGPLAGRGWTLSTGLVAAGGFAWLCFAWLLSCLTSGPLPTWIETAHNRWPLGTLPQPGDGDS
jgi:hypothetical protein